MSDQKYRELGPDEVIQEGDQIKMPASVKWVPCVHSVGQLASWKWEFRRPIEKTEFNPKPGAEPPSIAGENQSLREENERLRKELRATNKGAERAALSNRDLGARIAEVQVENRRLKALVGSSAECPDCNFVFNSVALNEGGICQSCEQGRWQNEIRNKIIELAKCPDSVIDGAGCDSGDPLDFTLTEITQGFNFVSEQLTAAQQRAEKAEEKLKTGAALILQAADTLGESLGLRKDRK